LHDLAAHNSTKNLYKKITLEMSIIKCLCS
jgi:hypothetical protein